MCRPGSSRAPATFKRWVHTGRVRTTRTEGGHHRVTEAELDRLAARQEPASLSRSQPQDDESLAGLSARNRLHGFIDEVRMDGLLAQVRLRVGDRRTAVLDSCAAQRLSGVFAKRGAAGAFTAVSPGRLK